MPAGLAGAGTVQQMSSHDSSSGCRAAASMSMCAAAGPFAASRCCRRRLADGGVDPCSEPSACAHATSLASSEVPGHPNLVEIREKAPKKEPPHRGFELGISHWCAASVQH